MFRCLILINVINGRGVLESANKCKENGKDEGINILCSVYPYVRKIILEDRKVGQYGTGRNQGYFLFVCLVGRSRSRR